MKKIIINEEIIMKKEYAEIQIELLFFKEDIVTLSNGDEHEDDIWA